MLLALLLSTGCFTYRPATVDSLTPGAQARVRVSPDAATRLGPMVEPELRTVEGMVVERSGGGLNLRIRGGNWPAGSVAAPMEQDVSLSASEVLEVQVRRLDRARTAGLAAVAGAVTGIWLVKQFRDAGGSPGGDDNGGSDHWRGGVGISLSLPVPLRFP